MFRRLFGVQAVLLAALDCALYGAIDTGGEPIVVTNGFAFVQAQINGYGPFRLLIDTGSESCLLTPEAARRSALTLDHRIVLASRAGEKTVPSSWGNRVQIGARTESDVEIQVTSLDQLRQIDPTVDGVLGMSFLRHFAYLLDYKNKWLWLGADPNERAGRLPFMVAAQWSGGRTVVPVRLEPNAKPWRLTLDSGSPVIVLACQ